MTVSPKATPFARVLETQQISLLLVLGSNVPVHSRLWCVYECYTAAVNSLQVDLVGDPLNLLAEEDRQLVRDAVEGLLEATADLDRANEEDSYGNEGFEDVVAEELMEEVQKKRAEFLRLLELKRIDVRESSCLIDRDKSLLWADMQSDADDVNDVIMQHIIARFSYYDMPALSTNISGLASAGLASKPFGREMSKLRRGGSFGLDRRMSRISQQETDDVQEKMQSFRVRRDDEKKAKLIRVLVISLSLLAIGAMVSCIGTFFLLFFFPAGEHNQCDMEKVMQLWDLLAQACGITGVLVMSTCCQCSTGTLTLDDIIVRQPAQVLVIVAMIAFKHFAKFWHRFIHLEKSNKVWDKVVDSGVFYPLLAIPAALSFYGAVSARRTGIIPEWARPTYLFIAVSLLWSCNYGIEVVQGTWSFQDALNAKNAELPVFRNKCVVCGHPRLEKPGRYMRLFSGVGLIGVSAVLTLSFLTSMWRQGFSLRRAARGSWAMKMAFWFLYAHLVLVCCGFLFGHFFPSLMCHNEPATTLLYLAQFVVYALPSTIVRLVGWERLLGWMDQKFESAQARRERDGAFIAELLGAVEVELGQVWWMHLEEGDKDLAYPKTDHRHHFVPGRVVNVGKDTFKVKIGNAAPLELPLAGRNCNQEYLVRRARADLRCIEWENLSLQLFAAGENVQGRQQANGIGNLFSLSRPVADYEVIDFFLSHSWHDSGIDKWVRLEAIASNFRIDHGRYPTFWLDRVCIRQENIGDGLAVLPVNVMACNKILVLAGETYPGRLWCALELVISFAFMPESQAVERVQLEPLGDHADEVLKQLSEFRVEDAHCYDPNEEARVRRVVNAVSKQHFESHIRTLARFLTYSQQSSRHFDIEATARENVRLQGQVRALHRELQLQQAEASQQQAEAEQELEELRTKYEALVEQCSQCDQCGPP